MKITIHKRECKCKHECTREVEEGTEVGSCCPCEGMTEKPLVAFLVNGHLVDSSFSLSDGDEVSFLSFQDSLGKSVFWHSSSHVLAQAVLRLWPNALPTIGPSIDQGFYYDFANLPLEEKDLKRIEEEMNRILAEGITTHRVLFPSKEEALEKFNNNPYKQEIIHSIPDREEISAYQQGEFIDLCAGPHLPSLGVIGSIRLLKISGSYWRGDTRGTTLTRIYGISFPSDREMESYLVSLEERKKRDHKTLGQQLDLFSCHECAPGMPLFHEHGLWIWGRLVEMLKGLLSRDGYREIRTPSMMSDHLWKQSGHWDHFRESMYSFEVEHRGMALKPMNCPGCMLFYKTKSWSYRDLPLRIAELGHVFRYELSGSLNGLFRARSFHQDDAHIFLTPDQVKNEVQKILAMADSIYSIFGLDYHMELSTRPEKGCLEGDWEGSTEGLRSALGNRPYEVREGEGAFYGPKIDLHVKDALGRSWQCGTVQLDFVLPSRFGLHYTTPKGDRACPVLIHRALFGSVERFLGIIIEHFAGKLPLWLSSRQVAILPVAERHVERAQELCESIREVCPRCEVLPPQETLRRRIREVQLMGWNYSLTIGDKEIDSISVRTRKGNITRGLSSEEFKVSLRKEVEECSLHSEHDVKGGDTS